MKYFFKFLLLISSYIFLISCGNNWSEFKKTMSGEKVTNTDEFLIKKKDPLLFYHRNLKNFHYQIQKKIIIMIRTQLRQRSEL